MSLGLGYLIALCKGTGKPFEKYEEELNRRNKSSGISQSISSHSSTAKKVATPNNLVQPKGAKNDIITPTTKHNHVLLDTQSMYIPPSDSRPIGGEDFEDEDIIQLLA